VGNLVCAWCADEDKARTEEICRKLDGSGLNIEIAGRWTGHEPWLEDRMASARFVLAFFSTQSGSESEGLNRFMEAALRSAQQTSKDRVFIIPVRFDRCELPEKVNHLQWIDLFKEGGFDQIVDVIRGELSVFTDSRDGQAYKTIYVGGPRWCSRT
jgi:TIR domain